MALGITIGNAANSTVDQSSYVTGTYTPGGSGRMVVLGIEHSVASGTIGDATAVTGASVTGMTKVASRPYNSTTTPIKKCEVWVGTSTGSAGTVTIALPNTPTGCAWCLAEVTGADLTVTTGGAGGVVQVVTAFSDTNVTAFSVTLAAFALAANGGLAFCGSAQNSGMTAPGAWSLLSGSNNLSTPQQSLGVVYRLTSNVTATGTLGVSAVWGGIAIEIATPPAGIPRAMAATVGTSTSAKVGLVARLRPVVAKLATATSAKAPILRRAKGIVAKVGTADGAKAAALLRTRTVTAKVATTDGAKATGLVEAKRLVAKAATATALDASARTTRRVVAKAATATSARTVLNRTERLVAKSGTASSATASLTKSSVKQFAAKVPTATSSKASTLVRGRTFTAKAGSSSSAKMSLLARRRPFLAKLPTADGAKATGPLGFARHLAANIPAATNATGDFDALGSTGGVRDLLAKAATTTRARATLQVGFFTSGFEITRAVGGPVATSTGTRAGLTTGIVSDQEAFNVARAVTATAGTTTSATATVIVSYFGSGGFLVTRTIRAKLATSSLANADVGFATEGFRVRRTIRTKLATADAAWATTLGQGPVVGPGFQVARALLAKVTTANSARASLGVTHGTLTVRFPTAASAKATTFSRAAGVAVRAATSSSAKASTRAARPLTARAATASAIKPVFLTTEHALQKSLGAKVNTTTGARASMRLTKALAARVATATSAKANRAASVGFRARAAIATSSDATFGYVRRLTATTATATSAAGSLAITNSRYETRISTATSARAQLGTFHLTGANATCQITLTDTGLISLAFTPTATIFLTVEDDPMDFVGTRKRVTIRVVDNTFSTPFAADPDTLTVTVQHVGDAPVVHAVGDLTRDAIGIYHLDVDCPEAGDYRVRAFAQGNVVAVDEAFWRVRQTAIVLV